MCKACDDERERLTQIATNNPMPCIVCNNHEVIGIGTWIPPATHRLAAGGSDTYDPIFAFHLCKKHSEPGEENETAIIQSILRDVRTGKGFNV